ncbi:MAG: YrhK family protein, partial [Sulfurovaceae bacterium]
QHFLYTANIPKKGMEDIMFLYSSFAENSTWLFIVGSAQLLIKPILKLVSLVYVERVYQRNITKIKRKQ